MTEATLNEVEHGTVGPGKVNSSEKHDDRKKSVSGGCTCGHVVHNNKDCDTTLNHAKPYLPTDLHAYEAILHAMPFTMLSPRYCGFFYQGCQ